MQDKVNTIAEFDKHFKEWKISKGRGRAILFVVAERIEAEMDEDGNEKPGPHPKPKNPIYRAFYCFLKKCMDGDLLYVRELLDRLDGKPALALELSGEVQHRYVARTPPIEQSTESWQQKYSPPNAPTLQ